MPDITKGYTFSDSKADWASQKDTAIRLNKMIDEAKVNITAGSGISVARTGGNIQVSATGGGGTVTNVSVVTANGVSGTVANPTTTPAITLALGAITPTSVAASGSVTGSNLSGTNTGDQTITLTGDVTGSGTGSFAATIANDAVTNSKLANVATATIKGRVSSGTGDPEDLTGTQATTLLDTFTSSLKGLAPASGGGTTNFLRADGTWAAPAGGGGGTVTDVSVVTANGVSGTVANSTTTPAITLSLGAITPTSVAATGTVTGSNLSGTNTGDQTITLTGDVTGSGTGSFATTIANGVVTNVKLQNSAITIAGTSTSLGGSITLDTIDGLSANGLIARTSANTRAARTITAGTGITVTNGDGVSGNPTITSTVIGVPTTAQQYARLVNNSTPVTAGSFVNGTTYVITSTGTTNFTLIGAANSLVGTVFTATGAGSGTGTATPSITSSSDMKWVGPDIYNVKDYGATGNGSTNDASAINSAIADINTAGFGCLYFPQGVYVVSSALTTITASCSVMGTGVSSTEIQFTVSGFKFDFSGTANSNTARVSDMKLTRTSGSSLVGIEYVPTTDTNARHRFDFSHLNLFDWGTAIYINGGGQNQIQSGFISYCHINGSGTRANSPYAIRIENATGVKINGCWFISVEKCVSVESHAESIGVQDCNAAAVDYFFYAVQDNVAGVPVLRADHRIINCYMAVDIRGVTIGNLDNINYCVIANNVIATQINTAEAIKIRGDYSSVIGNTIWPDKGSSPAVTIKVVSGNNNIISSNIIQDKAVVLESGTTSCRVVANTFKNVTGAFVSDSGTTNRCDEPTGKQVDKTLTGGAATENVDFDISAFGLSKKPQYFDAVISGTHGASKIMCCYDYGSASTTATNARCVAWMTDGTNLPSGSRTFNTAIVP